MNSARPLAARLLAPAAALAACSSARPAPPRPAADAVAVDRAPAAAPASTAAPDLLHCALEFRAYELGAAGDGPPSAPVAAGADSFLVAFTRSREADGGGTRDVYTQRVDAQGELRPAALVRAGERMETPQLFAHGNAARLVAAAEAGTSPVLVELGLDDGLARADAPALSLAGWPDDITTGPRGILFTHREDARRLVARIADAQGAAPPSLLPPSHEMPGVAEQLVASGPAADMVLYPVRGAVGLAAYPADGATPTEREFYRRTQHSWTEASLAAGPSGFVVVRTVPGPLRALLLDRFDARGAPAGETVTSAEPEEHFVRRYPRATALGEGWAVSYWDGTGPSLLRFERDGRAAGAPVRVRSGDERGGHTEARMAASGRALAVSWHVHEPERSHGFPEEEPRRPGPRLGVFRCRE